MDIISCKIVFYVFNQNSFFKKTFLEISKPGYVHPSDMEENVYIAISGLRGMRRRGEELKGILWKWKFVVKKWEKWNNEMTITILIQQMQSSFSMSNVHDSVGFGEFLVEQIFTHSLTTALQIGDHLAEKIILKNWMTNL